MPRITSAVGCPSTPQGRLRVSVRSSRYGADACVTLPSAETDVPCGAAVFSCGKSAPTTPHCASGYTTARSSRTTRESWATSTARSPCCSTASLSLLGCAAAVRSREGPPHTGTTERLRLRDCGEDVHVDPAVVLPVQDCGPRIAVRPTPSSRNGGLSAIPWVGRGLWKLCRFGYLALYGGTVLAGRSSLAVFDALAEQGSAAMARHGGPP